MSEYHLYADKNTYAMTTHLLLEELNADYEVTWFDLHKPENYPSEFIELNPNLRVPVLVTANGPVYESAATMMVLSEHHDGRFMPAQGSHQRSMGLQWLFYLMSTFQPEVLIQFHPERYFPNDSKMSDALLSASHRELTLVWEIIENSIETGPYFLGADFSICDMLFLMQAIWKQSQPANLADYPKMLRLMESALQRPAVQKVLQIHDIEHLAALG